MPKVLILDNELSDVFKLERILTEAEYEVCSLTGPYGILAKFDFEKPDILLFNPDMPNVDTDAILSTLISSPSMHKMVVVLLCNGDEGAVEEYCKQMNLHGYYMKDLGFEQIVDYLQLFYH